MAPGRDRSATASIRGYLYQTVLAAQAWVKLGPEEILVVEGDENFDRLLHGEQTSVQVKARRRSVGLRTVAKSLAAFAHAYAARDAGQDMRFLYLSTETLRPARDEKLDPLREWAAIEDPATASGEILDRLAAAVEALASEKAWGVPWPNGEADWRGFVGSVRFELDRPELAAARGELDRLLSLDPRSAKLFEVGSLAERVLDELWSASAQDEDDLRRRTREDLDELFTRTEATLAGWAQGDEAKSLSGWLDAATILDRLLDPGTRPLERPDSPSQLLDPRREVLPFLEAQREQELEDLESWCLRPLPVFGDVAVQLLVGPGGTGKTRLLVEVCKRMRAAGWHAGFVGAETPVPDVANLGSGSGPRLVVLDYAENRPDRTKAVLLAACGAKRRPFPFRVVLLAREAGPWLDALSTGNQDLEDLLVGVSGRLLLPLTLPEDREPIFGSMVEAFATARGIPVPDPLPAVDLADPSLDLALFLAMSALEASQGRAVVGTFELLEATLNHESRYWTRWIEGRGVPNEDDEARWAAAEAVAALTLHGSFENRTGAGRVLSAIAELEESGPPVSANQLVNLIRARYQRRSAFAEGLQPDVLGEHVVMRVLERAESGAGRWLAASLKNAAPEALANAFVVLGRLGSRLAQPSPGGTDRATVAGWITSALKTDLARMAEPAYQAAKSLGTQTAFASIADLLGELLASCDPATALPIARQLLADLDRMNPTPVSLRPLAETCGQLVIDALRREPSSDSADLAISLNNLGIRLSALGRREEALAATEEAVEIRRHLAASRPDAFLPDLAMSLNNLGIRLSALGRREEALAATEKAVEIRRQLAASRPDAFLPDLAMSLNNLGVGLSELGRREEALAATEEAVEIRRHLAASRPDAFLPDLAMSLNNLGIRLSALGRREEALAATEKAVEIRRQLAASRPDAFLPDLASALNNLGGNLSALGRREEALAATEEAVEQYRQLAASRPDAFLPDLAMSLNNLGNCQSALGRREEALAATEKAVELRRQLAASRPDAFLPDLATALNNLGGDLSALGRREEALAATEEAVEQYRQLAASRPDAFLPDLAMSLNNLGGRLSELGRREEALAATEEAVKQYRQLAASRPDAFLPDHARALNNLGNRLSELGRREEALAATEEAVEQYRQLAASHPDAFLPDLAMSLNNLGAFLSALGRREEALAATEEAVEIRRHLAASRPDAFLPDLARTLGLQGSILLDQSDIEEAAAVLTEGLRSVLPTARRVPAAVQGLALALARDLRRALAGEVDEASRALLDEVEALFPESDSE